MHYTLHLTDACNMNCDYCYVNKDVHSMSTDVAFRTVELAASKNIPSCGIIFFGGEPLLQRELICETISYCKSHTQNSSCRTKFHFKITTNGILLDEEFLDYSLRENIFIALSHDGVKAAHDLHRKDKNGTGTYDMLESIIPLLLKARPYCPVMMTVNPDTVHMYADGVKELWKKGFRYIICSLNYAGEWDERTIAQLKKQYELLAEFYYDLTLMEEKFYLSPFEVKIASHIQGDSYCHERCELGRKQISVSPQGKLYPCVQFVGDDDYCIGDVYSGINEQRRAELYRLNENEKLSCINCAISKRCNHFCACLNKQTTGCISKVSPVLCAHERVLMPIADKLAARLFKQRNGLFIQKHYNDVYPLISMIEDMKK